MNFEIMTCIFTFWMRLIAPKLFYHIFFKVSFILHASKFWQPCCIFVHQFVFFSIFFFNFYLEIRRTVPINHYIHKLSFTLLEISTLAAILDLKFLILHFRPRNLTQCPQKPLYVKYCSILKALKLDAILDPPFWIV